MSDLDQAIFIASQAHRGQRDKGGAPYILHPLRVMARMKSDEERIVAVLHDVIEDNPFWTPYKLRRRGFGDNIIRALAALTRDKGESYEAFIERCGANPLARRVKLADLDDNSDLTRIPAPTERDWDRMKKYGRAITYLIGLPA